MIKHKINFLIGFVLLIVQFVSSLCFGQPLGFMPLIIAICNIVISFI